VPSSDPLIRFRAKIIILDGHWLWQGSINKRGYPTFWVGPGKADTVLAHRFCYINWVGPIPDDRPQIDHACPCERLICITPESLEPVTNEENQRRAAIRRRLRKERHERDRVGAEPLLEFDPSFLTEIEEER
jgi:hypothetical protein